MPIQARSADGVIHSFADGTPDSVIDRVMADYARESSGKKPEDDYTRTARQEMQDEQKKLGTERYGVARQAIQGATMGGADEVLAALGTPVQMIKRGTLNPLEGYRHAKAREDVELEDARRRGGATGTVAEVGGSVMSGTGLARAGLTAFRPGMGYLPRVAAGATEGVAMGAAQGGLEAQDGERLEGASKGAVLGGIVGGGLTAAGPVVGAIASPITSQIAARANPRAAADRQVGRAVMETGRSADDIANALDGAAADGQGGVYTLADELGNPGQRMLSTVARTPGEGRTRAVQQLDQRQAGQGRRLVTTLDEGFGTGGQTAQQAEGAIRESRDAVSDVNYGNARLDARGSVVDIDPVLAQIDRAIGPTNAAADLGEVGLEGTLRGIRGQLMNPETGVVRTDFNSLLNLKVDLDGRIEEAPAAVQRILIPIRNTLDERLAASSRSYANARNTHRAMSLPLDALEQGRQAARTGRVENNIDTFQGLQSRDAQQGFRTGYVDPMIAKIQNQSPRSNKTIPLSDDAFQQESRAFAAPGRGPQMTRRLDRESRMAETYEQARTGSRTSDNLADDAALGVDPSIALDVASGNTGGMVRGLITRISAASKGLTPEVRDQVAQILLQTPGTATNANIRATIQRVERAERQRQLLSQALLRGAATGSNTGEQRRTAR